MNFLYRPLLTALLILSGCYLTSTTHGDAGADDEDLADATPPTCPEPLPCELPGMALEYDMDTEGEVVEVSDERIVLRGFDGHPQTFGTCGLSAEDVVAVGERYSIHHLRLEEGGTCWVSTLVSAAGGISVLVARCVDNWQPPFGDLGLEAELLSSCEHQLDYVCSETGEAVYLSIPETVLDLRLTPSAGEPITLSIGETVDLQNWRARLLDARLTEAIEGGGCNLPVEGAFLIVFVQKTSP